MACAILKISHQEEIRRMELKKSEFSYSDVTQGISKLFPDLKDYTAKYFDEEGDACTFCKASFKDFLAVSRAMASQAVTNKTRQATLLLKLQLVGPTIPKEQACAKGAFGTEESNRRYDEQKQFEASSATSADRVVCPVIVADGRKLQIEWKRGDDPAQVAANFAQTHGIQEELAAIVDFVRHAENVTHPSSAVRDERRFQQDTKEGKDGNEGTTALNGIEAQIMHVKTNSQVQEKVRPCANVDCTYQATWHATNCCHACSIGQGHGPRCERLQQVFKPSRDLKTLPEIIARICAATVPNSLHPLDKEDIFEISENLDNLKPKSDLDRESRREWLKKLDQIEASLDSKRRSDC
eukprot:TRINITY_DN61147_c0_g1_i1.p1 TRINITY_DN61147_c0_g1~~TRINITY_DN61147_c0_g1_i1.p1  ORF type:complete len:379 (-),score=66.54 TRINITY_DN61147_c0_g1_i1:231-1289(-)